MRASELARNKTDKLDAVLSARFCPAHRPIPWTPPAAHLRELRELMRRFDSLEALRVQEINRQKSGAASATLKMSIADRIKWLEQQIEETMAAAQVVVASDPVSACNQALMLTIPGIGPVTAAIMSAEVLNTGALTPEELPTFRQPRRISRIGSERFRWALYKCSLRSKRRNPVLRELAQRMVAVWKPPKVILLAIVRELLVFARAIVQTQKPLISVSLAPS